MTYQDEVLADNPAWYLRMDESSGSLQDFSGNGRHASVNGSIIHGTNSLLASEPEGKSVGFNSSGYLSIPFLAADNVNSFTVEQWIWTSSTITDLEGIHAETGPSEKLWRTKIDDTTGRFVFSWWSTSGSTLSFEVPKALNDSSPHHIVAVVSSGVTLRLYIDGVLELTSSRDGIWSGNAALPSAFTIGAFRLTPEAAGSIDQAAFYRSALSSSRVLAHYNAGVTVGSGVEYDPVNFTLTESGDAVDLACDPSPTANVVGYRWFRRTPETGVEFNPEVDSALAETAGTSYTDNSISLDTEYEYQVFGKIETESTGGDPGDGSGGEPSGATVGLPTRFLGGYVELYQSNTYPDEVPNANMAIMAFYGVNSTRRLYRIYEGNMNYTTLQSRVATMKSQNKPVIMGIGGSGAGYVPRSSAEATTLAADIVAECRAMGFSGLDVNYELWSVETGAFTLANSAYVVQMMRAVKADFEATNDPFSLSIAPYGFWSGQTQGPVRDQYLYIADQLTNSPNVLGFVGFQFYNADFLFNYTMVKACYQEYAALGVSPQQWCPGFLSVFDEYGLVMPYQNMADIVTSFRNEYGAIAGAWTWGVNAKEAGHWSFFNNPVLSAVNPTTSLLGDGVPDDGNELSIQSVSANGDDGNVPANVIDGDSTTRWSHDANPSVLTADLGASYAVGGVGIHHYNGASGDLSTFDIELSADGSTWNRHYLGRSSGTLDDIETFRFPQAQARYIRYVGYGRDESPWNSIVEFQVLVPTATSQPPATPNATATPGDALVTLGGVASRPTPAPTSWRWLTGTSSPPATQLVTGLSSPEYLHQPVTNGVLRYYRLQAINSDGTGQSQILSVTPSGTAATEISHGMDLTLADVGTLDGVTRTSAGTSQLSTSSSGQTIQNLNFQGSGNDTACIVVNHNNVTIKNCRILSGSGPQEGIKINSGVTGTVIENCSIDGQQPLYTGNFGNGGINAGGGPFEARRNHIINVRVGIQAWKDTAGSVMEENWVDDIWGNANSGVSTGGISWRGAGLTSPPLTTMNRNYVRGGASALAYCYPDNASCRNFQMNDNYLIGLNTSHKHCGYGLRGGWMEGSDYTHMGNDYQNNRDIKIEGNRFAGTFNWNTNGGVNPNQPGNTWVNNRWVGSNTDIPPKLTL